MNYDKVMAEYIELRHKIKEIEDRVKLRVGPMKKQLADLEAKIAQAAQEDGLQNVKTKYGTGYWSVHHSCKTANPSVFFDYCLSHEAWDLLEKRPSKKAIAGYVEEHGTPPPGIDFGSHTVFNVREEKSDE